MAIDQLNFAGSLCSEAVLFVSSFAIDDEHLRSTIASHPTLVLTYHLHHSYNKADEQNWLGRCPLRWPGRATGVCPVGVVFERRGVARGRVTEPCLTGVGCDARR